MGTVSVATLGSLLLVSMGIVKTGKTVQDSQQSFLLASSCAEHALQSLWNDPSYAGGEILPSERGECEILPIGGYGNENRSVCVEGRQDGVNRRLEILLQRILPSIQVQSWKEVESFTLCKWTDISSSSFSSVSVGSTSSASSASEVFTSSASANVSSFSAASTSSLVSQCTNTTTLAYGSAVFLPHSPGVVHDLTLVALTESDLLSVYWLQDSTNNTWTLAATPASVHSRTIAFGTEKIVYGPEMSNNATDVVHNLTATRLDDTHALLFYNDGFFGCRAVIATQIGAQITLAQSADPQFFGSCQGYLDAIALTPTTVVVAHGPNLSMVTLNVGTINLAEETMTIGIGYQTAAGFNMAENGRPFALARHGNNQFVVAALNGPAVVYRPWNPFSLDIALASGWQNVINSCLFTISGPSIGPASMNNCTSFIRNGGAPLSAIDLNGVVAITPALEEFDCHPTSATVIVGIPTGISDSAINWTSLRLPATSFLSQPFLIRLSDHSYLAAYAGLDGDPYVVGNPVPAAELINLAPPPWVPYAGVALTDSTVLFADAGPTMQRDPVRLIAGGMVTACDPRCGNGVLDGDDQCDVGKLCGGWQECIRGRTCMCALPLSGGCDPSSSSSAASLSSSSSRASAMCKESVCYTSGVGTTTGGGQCPAMSLAQCDGTNVGQGSCTASNACQGLGNCCITAADQAAGITQCCPVNFSSSSAAHPSSVFSSSASTPFISCSGTDICPVASTAGSCSTVSIFCPSGDIGLPTVQSCGSLGCSAYCYICPVVSSQSSSFSRASAASSVVSSINSSRASSVVSSSASTPFISCSGTDICPVSYLGVTCNSVPLICPSGSTPYPTVQSCGQTGCNSYCYTCPVVASSQSSSFRLASANSSSAGGYVGCASGTCQLNAQCGFIGVDCPLDTVYTFTATCGNPSIMNCSGMCISCVPRSAQSSSVASAISSSASTPFISCSGTDICPVSYLGVTCNSVPLICPSGSTPYPTVQSCGQTGCNSYCYTCPVVVSSNSSSSQECSGGAICNKLNTGGSCLPVNLNCLIGTPVTTGQNCAGVCYGQCFQCPNESMSSSSSSFRSSIITSSTPTSTASSVAFSTASSVVSSINSSRASSVVSSSASTPFISCSGTDICPVSYLGVTCNSVPLICPSGSTPYPTVQSCGQTGCNSYCYTCPVVASSQSSSFSLASAASSVTFSTPSSITNSSRASSVTSSPSSVSTPSSFPSTASSNGSAGSASCFINACGNGYCNTGVPTMCGQPMYENYTSCPADCSAPSCFRILPNPGVCSDGVTSCFSAADCP